MLRFVAGCVVARTNFTLWHMDQWNVMSLLDAAATSTTSLRELPQRNGIISFSVRTIIWD